MIKEVNMKRFITLLPLFVMLVFLSACGSEDKPAQEVQKKDLPSEDGWVREGPIDVKAIDVDGDGYVYQDHMDWNVIADEEGKCPECGMSLKRLSVGEAEKNLRDNGFEVIGMGPGGQDTQQKIVGSLSPKEKIINAKGLLAEAKADLAQAGKYSCCVKHPCNSCALEHQSCGCYESLKAGKAVCNDCYAGWQRGGGVDKDIKKDQVKTSYAGHQH
jgi:hypothetical protein